MTKTDAAIDAQERKYHHLHGRGDTANEMLIAQGGLRMTPEEIAATAEALREEAAAIPEPGMTNYRSVIASYVRISNDHSVLVRELAQSLTDVLQQLRVLTAMIHDQGDNKEPDV